MNAAQTVTQMCRKAFVTPDPENSCRERNVGMKREMMKM
jgi:hypothetical protein